MSKQKIDESLESIIRKFFPEDYKYLINKKLRKDEWIKLENLIKDYSNKKNDLNIVKRKLQALTTIETFYYLKRGDKGKKSIEEQFQLAWDIGVIVSAKIIDKNGESQYKPEKGASLETYICGTLIRRSYAEGARLTREMYSKYTHTKKKKLEQELDQLHTLNDINKIKHKQDELKQLEQNNKTISLNREISDSDDTRELQDFIKDSKAILPEDILDRENIMEFITLLSSKFTPKELKNLDCGIPVPLLIREILIKKNQLHDTPLSYVKSFPTSPLEIRKKMLHINSY